MRSSTVSSCMMPNPYATPIRTGKATAPRDQESGRPGVTPPLAPVADQTDQQRRPGRGHERVRRHERPHHDVADDQRRNYAKAQKDGQNEGLATDVPVTGQRRAAESVDQTDRQGGAWRDDDAQTEILSAGQQRGDDADPPRRADQNTGPQAALRASPEADAHADRQAAARSQPDTGVVPADRVAEGQDDQADGGRHPDPQPDHTAHDSSSGWCLAVRFPTPASAHAPA